MTLLSVLQRTAGVAFRGRVVVYVAGASGLLVFVAALAVLDSERSAPQAFSPVTDAGRLIAGGLMLGGIALLGVVTATLASWIVERVSQQEEDAQAATRPAPRSECSARRVHYLSPDGTPLFVGRVAADARMFK
ncbi:hypothetical protein [Glaciibacter sp. 2TAF33]|uniref:hypothetical protein n=1 Tax=Glaciibacter sp. 2TAF33 TaxID=3233015 RepID=UPI003F9341C2